jgi:hypothetical protein
MAENNGASTAIVALIAILVIIAIGFVVMRVIPGMGDGGASDVNVEIPTPDLGGGE